MASLHLLRPASLAVGFTITSATAAQLLLRPRERLLCDFGDYSLFGSKDWSFKKEPPKSSWSNITKDIQKPLEKGGWKPTPAVVRQVSKGSVLGVLGGLTLSIFSKPLALLIGLLVFGVQYLEYRGINVIPHARVQRYFGSINLRTAMRENVAFKLSFGMTFALAAFSQF